MNIHEYQSKELLRRIGVPVPPGTVACSAAEAVAAAGSLPGPAWVVKAQILAGGRGKGGGVRICRSPEEVGEAAGAILGMRLVTAQTGPEGKLVSRVLVEQGAMIAREMYVSVVLDRARGCLTVMASPDGGMDIEQAASSAPGRIVAVRTDTAARLWPFQLRRLLKALGLSGAAARAGAALLQQLASFAEAHDATLVEVNPLALTADGQLLVIDAKMDFDDSALKRHPEIEAMRDPEEGDPLERRAREQGVNYVRLHGSVGTMVNGAGLAMATMDAVKQAGAEPANFLDVGGGADAKAVAAGFSIILSDPRVRCILVNIFGGILRCDIVARGIADAARSIGLQLPLVIRLEGTNVEEGRRILRESGLAFHEAASMSDAARRAAELAGGA